MQARNDSIHTIHVESSSKAALHKYRGAFRAVLRDNAKKGPPALHLLVVAGLVFPGTGTATRNGRATGTRAAKAFGQAVAEFPEDAQSAQRLVLAT
jgi:hypothetical protein